MGRKTVFIFFLLFVQSQANNITIPEDFKEEYQLRNEHKMALYWKLHSILSPIGICFNGVILYMFVDERKSLIKSINVMIW